MRITKWILIILGAIFIVPVAYFYATYVDDTISDGAGYGFTIGEDKLSAFKIINNNALSNKVYAIQVGVDSNSFKLVDIHQDAFEEINRFNTWNLLLREERDFLNTIRLTFDGNKLTKIYRHKQWLELP